MLAGDNLEQVVDATSYNYSNASVAVDSAFIGASLAMLGYYISSDFPDLDNFILHQHTVKAIFLRGAVGLSSMIPKLRNKYYDLISRCKAITNYLSISTGIIGSVLVDSYFYKNIFDNLKDGHDGLLSVTTHTGMVATSLYDITANQKSNEYYNNKKILLSVAMITGLGFYTYINRYGMV